MRLFILALATIAMVGWLKSSLLTMGLWVHVLVFLLLFLIVIGLAFRVTHHAERLAEHWGEPYGTLILTSTAVTVEVVILVMMLLHEHNPTLARDTIYAALMIDINGILGLAAIVGGMRYGEQSYNVESGNTYLSMISVAVGLSMVLPSFIPMDQGVAFSLFSIVAMAVLYALFLHLQTGRHSYFFDHIESNTLVSQIKTKVQENRHEDMKGNTTRDTLGILFSIILIGVLTELMAVFLAKGLTSVPAIPKMLPAILVALISASPEILTATRAALKNRMQAVINIGLGAALATVVLTIPIIEITAMIQKHSLTMALTPVQTGILMLTLFVASINLHNGETNTIEGYTHGALFATFLFLSSLGL